MHTEENTCEDYSRDIYRKNIYTRTKREIKKLLNGIIVCVPWQIVLRAKRQYVDIRIDSSYRAKLLLMKSWREEAFAMDGENCRLSKEDCNKTDKVRASRSTSRAEIGGDERQERWRKKVKEESTEYRVGLCTYSGVGKFRSSQLLP